MSLLNESVAGLSSALKGEANGRSAAARAAAIGWWGLDRNTGRIVTWARLKILGVGGDKFCNFSPWRCPIH